MARALVRRAPVYIFDDSFSALDFKTEAAVRGALQSYTAEAAVLVVAIVRHPKEFNRVGVFKKFHFVLPLVELLLVASLCFVTASNASPAGYESVMSLVAGEWSVVFWLLFIVVGLVGPTLLETWLLFFSPREFEESRKAHVISFASDAGVLVGGFVLRLLVLVAAVPITMVTPWL